MDNAPGDEPDGADQHRQRHREAQSHRAGAVEPVRAAAGGAGRLAGRARRRRACNALEVADDATAQAGYELAGPADQVKVEILAPSGKVIDTLNLGAQTNGVHSFDWQAGANASTTGLRFRVTATSGSVNTAATDAGPRQGRCCEHRQQRLQPRARQCGDRPVQLDQSFN
jgi:hypothetical protein